MLAPYPDSGKLPTYNFVIEMSAPSKHLHKFADEVLNNGHVNFNVAMPEEKILIPGERRKWRISNWGSSKLPKVNSTRFLNDKLILSAESLIGFPESALRAIFKMYGIKVDRGICLADDESEAFLISGDKEDTLKAKHLTRMQMREYGILKML